ncbi:MAG: type II secretion system protein GspM [Pseudomonas sp.]
MNDWWAGLAQRERIVLMVGSGLLGLIVVWLMVVEPVIERKASLRENVASLSADFNWMQQVSTEVRRRQSMQGSGQAGGVGAGSVLTLVEVSANASGIKSAMERVQPEGQGARLWFDSVGFDPLVSWLAELEQRQGLKISQLSIDAGNEPGVVSARVLVEPR